MLSTKLNNLQILQRKQVLSVDCFELHFRLELENLAFLCDFQVQTPPNLGQRCHRPSGTLRQNFSQKLQKFVFIMKTRFHVGDAYFLPKFHDRLSITKFG